MRKSVRLFSEVGPEERLGAAISRLPASAQRALLDVADREDLPLVAGSWTTDHGGCLVANVVAAVGRPDDSLHATLDLRVLELFPDLSSVELNRLIVAWDEAAMQEGRGGDPALRRLLRGALARANVVAQDSPKAPATRNDDGGPAWMGGDQAGPPARAPQQAGATAAQLPASR